jgi:hypothetical protein
MDVTALSSTATSMSESLSGWFPSSVSILQIPPLHYQHEFGLRSGRHSLSRTSFCSRNSEALVRIRKPIDRSRRQIDGSGWIAHAQHDISVSGDAIGCNRDQQSTVCAAEIDSTLLELVMEGNKRGPKVCRAEAKTLSLEGIDAWASSS